MTDFKKDLSKIFKSSKIFIEQEKTEINEKLWDDIKGEWNKGKEIAKAPIKNLGKNLRDTIASRIFNKAPEKKLRVSGTGETNPKPPEPSKPTDASKDDPNKTINVPPGEFGADNNQKPISQTAANAAAEKPVDKPIEPAKPKEIPKNDDAMIIDPKSGRNIVHPDKPIVILNPQGIELQGVEDSNQKEKKILNPIKNILKKKNAEIGSNFEKLRQKNNIISPNSTDEISQKDPTDPVRKAILRDLFAIKFYNDAYKGLLKNLKDMNIITENKIDYGTFQQAINNALETSTEVQNRRFKLKRKKINNLVKNEKDVKMGLKKGKDLFSKDMNSIYTSNKDKFTQPLLQEGVKYCNGFFKEEFIYEEEPKVDDKKEDNTIRANDYVWWLDDDALEKALEDDEKRKLLTFKKVPIELIRQDNGKYFNGTSAEIKYLAGSKKNEMEKVDVRNIDIPEKIAKDMTRFGKVLNNTENFDQKIEILNNEIADITAQLNGSGISDAIRKENEEKKAKLEKEKGIAEKQKTAKGNIGSVAKIQKFVAKDKNSLAKTIASGSTKITPDPDNKPIEVDAKKLVKLNKEGKSRLLKVIGVAAITIHSLINFMNGTSIHEFLTKIDSALANTAKRFGDMAGSKSETNF
jgi:hypothetical protein